MILDKDIIFVSTSLKSKWLKYSAQLVFKFFPRSEYKHVDGSKNWPLVWFEWIKIIASRERKQKYIVLIDEDCFLTNKEELLNVINFLDANNYSISGISDAYSYYRRFNPIAINSFLMICNINHILDLNINLEKLKIWYYENEYKNSYNIYWKEKYTENFIYPYEKIGPTNYSAFEPYYFLFWMLKEQNRKFYYLYPHFDEYFCSINPKFNKDSKELAIHMWYAREWNSTELLINGLSNLERYNRIEKTLINILDG